MLVKWKTIHTWRRAISVKENSLMHLYNHKFVFELCGWEKKHHFHRDTGIPWVDSRPFNSMNKIKCYQVSLLIKKCKTSYYKHATLVSNEEYNLSKLNCNGSNSLATNVSTLRSYVICAPYLEHERLSNLFLPCWPSTNGFLGKMCTN